MNIKDYVKKYNIPFNEVKSEFEADFNALYESEKDWLENLENKIHLLKNEKNELALKQVIQKLKGNNPFQENDTPILSMFVSKVNTIVRIANRINNFKEGTNINNGSTLKLHDFFNAVKGSKNLNSFDYQLNSNLVNFLPHIYSVIKHCQNPLEYPIYYKYWKNILREVLSKDDDYESMCTFYRNFPSKNRHLNFATYLGTIGIQIAKNIASSGLTVTKDSKEYKYLTNDVINIERYNSILDDNLPSETNNLSNRNSIYDSLRLKMENAGFQFETEQKPHRQNRDETELKFIHPQLLEKLENEGYKLRATKFYIKPLSNEPNCEIGFVTGKSSPIVSEQLFGLSNSVDSYDNTPAWTNKDNDTALDELLESISNFLNTPENNMNFPLNTILYGPPGTGKTYNTILRAAQIVENRVIDSYDEALEVFKANLHNKIEFITFHQNYSYEDFIQGLRPDTENDNQLTFERKDGVFKEIADKALKNLIESEKPQLLKRPFEEVFNQFINPLIEGEIEEIEVKMKKVSYFITAISNKSIDFRKASGGTAHTLSIGTLKKMYSAESVLEIQGLASYYTPLLAELLKLGKDSSGKKEQIKRQDYVIIIDEINRANISRVFGELITLIEPDKRSHGAIPLEARLPSGDPFIVPSNLFIIGTMNTADKSIALLDIALRRRFEFESMYPKYEIDDQEIFDVQILEKINKQIIDSKGHDFQIGHAYFMGDNKDLIQRMNKKVIPLLLEYYMNDKEEVKGILKKAGLIIVEGSWPLKISGKND